MGDAVRSSGADFGGIGFGDPVGEFDAFDDAWHLICTIQAAPFLRRSPNEGEDHQLYGLL